MVCRVALQRGKVSWHRRSALVVVDVYSSLPCGAIKRCRNSIFFLCAENSECFFKDLSNRTKMVETC